MAKALFHKSQRVYVKPVGTYALIEKVVPHWVKGVEEPLKVTYDCGLGREFKASELRSEDSLRGQSGPQETHECPYEQWRLERHANRYISPEETAHHPYPGTYPVVQTDDKDWGGWRVPGAEYNRDPALIEYQARILVGSPDMLRVCKALVNFFEVRPQSIPDDLKDPVNQAHSVLRFVYEQADDAANLKRINE